MKNVLITATALAFLAACDTPGQSAATGAAIGAGIGAATAGKDEKGGALFGGVAGAIAGIAVHAARSDSRTCYVLNDDGTRTYVDCPPL